MIKKILLLDDEKDICAVLTDYLESMNYIVRSASTMDEFQTLLKSFAPDFLLIDKYIHRGDSFPLISQIRQEAAFKTLPIVVVTGCEDFDEKLRALEMGADDVLHKPIRLEELSAKINTISRRSSSYQPAQAEVVFKDLKLSPLSGEVFVGDTKLPLTETEFKLLRELIMEKGRPVHRESLAHKGLTSRNNHFRTIDVHINSLRNKLGEMGRNIKTLRGRGYMLVD